MSDTETGFFSQDEGRDCEQLLASIVSKLHDLNASALDVSDIELSKLLDKYELWHGPVTETTRTLYKRMLIREMRRVNGHSNLEPENENLNTNQEPEAESKQSEAKVNREQQRDIEKLVADRDYSDIEEDDDDDFDSGSNASYDDDEEEEDEEEDEDDKYYHLQQQQRVAPARVPSAQLPRQQQQQKQKSSTVKYVLMAVAALAVAYWLASQIED